MSPIRSTWWLAPVSALGLLACQGAASSELGLLGCDEVRRGPSCVLKESESSFQVVIEAPPGAEISAIAGDQPLRIGCDNSPAASVSCVAQPGGNKLQVRVEARPQRIQIVVKTPGWFGSRKFDIAVENPVPLPPWLTEATRLRVEAARPQKAEQLVLDHLKPELSTEDRARAYSELAQALQEQLQTKEAEAAIQQAIRLDEEAGLLSGKALDLMILAELLYDRRRLHALERMLDANQEVFALVARWRPWRPLYRAQNALALGDLEQALLQLNYADQLNGLSGDERSAGMAKVLRSSLRSVLGQERTDALVAEAAKQLSDYPCRHGLLLRRQAAMRLQILESELAEDVKPDLNTMARLRELWQRWESEPLADPDSLLREHDRKVQALLTTALGIFNGEGPLDAARKPRLCAIPRHIGLTILTQARLALLMGRTDDARAYLEQFRGVLTRAHVSPETSPTFGLEWIRLSAQLARSQGRYKDALAIINQLEQYAGEDYRAFEVHWTKLYGRALALHGLGPRRRDEAVAALREADATIVEASQSAPQLFGCGPLAGRFEQGRRLLLELLLRVEAGRVLASQEELVEVLALMRQLRVRPLLDLGRGERIQRLSESQKQRFSTAVAEYLAARHALDRALAHNEPRPLIDELEARAHQRLAGAVAYLKERAIKEQADPRPGEVLLICHPLRRSWACLAATRGRIDAATFAPDELRQPPLSDRSVPPLLASFRSQLHGASRLAVLGYGEFRNLAVHLLPFEGQLLGQRLLVSYPLDIPQAAARRAQSSRALLVVDSNLEYSDPTVERIAIAAPLWESLKRSRRFEPQLIDMGGQGDSGTGSPTGETRDLRKELEGAGLLVLFGHMKRSPGNGWNNGITWAPWSRLTGGDIMTLAQVPPRAILIACGSGSGEDSVGGQESLGLAQAFLLRGSQEVLAATREVTAEAGVLVARRVLEHLAAAPEDSLTTALSESVAALASGDWLDGAQELPGHDPKERRLLERIQPQLDAFRVLSQ